LSIRKSVRSADPQPRRTAEELRATAVNIPLNFRLMNLHRVYDATAYAREEYARIGTVPWLAGKRAAEGTECGECEEKCPQQIPIRKQLQESVRVLGRS
jgi:predicted aldo/keto reductase-like oxidoreductase